jgi:hypothetical protein
MGSLAGNKLCEITMQAMFPPQKKKERKNKEREKEKKRRREKYWRGQAASCGAFMRPGNGQRAYFGASMRLGNGQMTSFDAFMHSRHNTGTPESTPLTGEPSCPLQKKKEEKIPGKESYHIF